MTDEKEEKEILQASKAEDLDVAVATGRITKIIVSILILIFLAGGIVVLYLFFLKPESERKIQIQKNEDFLSAYSALRATGYDEFWKCVFPLATEEQANSNLKLENVIKNAISQNEEAFGKHILECIPSLEKHIDGAKSLDGPQDYVESVKELPKTLQMVHDSWKALGDWFAGAGERNRWDKRLDEVSEKGWGQMYVDYEKRKKSTDETLKNARRYMKFITCSVGKTYSILGKTVSDVENNLVNEVLGANGVCSTPEKAMERADYIEKVCVPFLTSPEPPPPDQDWEHVVRNALFYETRSIAVVAGSWEGQDGCLRSARKEKEKVMIQNLFNAWVAYKKVAKNIEDIYRSKMKELKKR